MDGRRGWYAQCGFESVAACFIFPGRLTVVEATCLDCGEPLRIATRDGVVESAAPRGIVGYVDIPFRQWRPNLALA